GVGAELAERGVRRVVLLSVHLGPHVLDRASGTGAAVRGVPKCEDQPELQLRPAESHLDPTEPKPFGLERPVGISGLRWPGGGATRSPGKTLQGAVGVADLIVHQQEPCDMASGERGCRYVQQRGRGELWAMRGAIGEDGIADCVKQRKGVEGLQ